MEMKQSNQEKNIPQYMPEQPVYIQSQYIPPMPPYAAPGMEQEPKKLSIGARIGYFFLSLTPAAACLALQILFGAICMIVYGIFQMILFMAQNPGVSQSAAMEVYMEAMLESATGGVFLYHLLSIPIFGLWYYFGCKKPKLKQSVKNVSLQAVVIAVVGGVAMCLMSNGIVGIEAYLLPDIVEEFNELMESMDIGMDALATISTVCLAPIGEEILCRGLILYYSKKALPRFWMANILQAIMFGAIHANWVQGIYAFAGGLFMGWLYERFHSLIPCMIVHFVINFSSVFWVDKAFAWFPDELYAFVILFAITLVITLGLVFWGGSKKKRRTLPECVIKILKNFKNFVIKLHKFLR